LARLDTVEIKAAPFSNTALSTPAIEVLLEGETLRNAPQHSLDGILRDVPGFRLYRRSDSTTAHPTTQGVSLGNAGPNGASRTIVLLDGVPMNDPFGGWLAWNRFSPENLSGVRLVPQAGVSPWGTASLGGVISLDSRFLNEAPFVSVQAAAGDRLRHEGSFAFAQDSASGMTRIFGGMQESDFAGYPVIREDQRGAVDIRASSRAQAYDAGIRHSFAKDGEWHLTLRSQGWKEQRNNGTPLTTNSGDALDFSARLSRETGPHDWATETILFSQKRRFESFFSSVAADRNSEKPSLDQYAVPAESYGIIERLRIPIGEAHSIGTGADFRTTQGVTRERFRYLGNAFTQEREAGGRQSDVGVYLQDTWTPSKEWQFHGGTRLEWHGESEGHLREWDIQSHVLSKERDYADHETLTPNVTLNTKWTPNQRVEVSAAVYSGARNPTLNELYRPFRAGDVVTLANPTLRKESVCGGELGIQMAANESWKFHVRAFENRMRNAIANINEVKGPGTIGDWGFLSAGGIGARRENVDCAEVRGLDAGADWTIGHGLTLCAKWLGTQSEVHRCAVRKTLEGRSLPQVPSQQLSLQLKGDFTAWRWEINGRWTSRQFDDDENQLTLASYATFDVRVSRRISRKTEIFAAIENVADAEIQTRRDANGTISTGAPRMWSAGFRTEF
jgi:outer membrane cobalamin receptor